MLSHHHRHAVGVALLVGFVLAAPRVSTALNLGGLPDEAAAKAASSCQKAIGKAGEKFIKNKQKTLDKCLTALFKCVQRKATNDQLLCNVKVGAKCEKKLDAIFDKHEPALEAAILKKCEVNGKLTAADVLTPAGLDFQRQAASCQADFGVTLTTVGDIAECIRRQKECTVERLLRLQFPRAAERLSAGGVNDINRLTCLMGSTVFATGFGGTDPKTGKALDKCAKETKKAGAKFVSSKVKSLEKCLGEIFKCVQTKQNDQDCIDKAAIKCGKEFGADGKIAKAELKLRSSIQKKCGGTKGPSFSDLASANGMHLTDLASTCAQVAVDGPDNLNEYIECMYRHHECSVDMMVATQYPRLEDLLTEVGFEDEVPAIFCP